MNPWETFDAIFFISAGTLLVGLCGLSIKYCLKSKCEHFSLCCGLIKIDRRVDLEVEEEMKKIEMGTDTKDEENNDMPNIDLSQFKKR